jgi:uncharacterized protein
MPLFNSIKLEIDVPARMRDGAVLRADIYRPDTAEKYPAILIRLPYLKNMLATQAGIFHPQRFAQNGYAVVIQDCRGTGSSDGELYPFLPEPEDGYDTVEWVAAQPWCNGNVGMYGVSYLGFTQWTATIMQPPHLKAICPGESSAFELPTMERGLFHLQASVRWFLNQCSLAIPRSKLTPEEAAKKRAYLVSLLDNLDEQYAKLPLIDMPPAHVDGIAIAPFLIEWIKYWEDEAYWKKFHYPIPLEKVAVPCFHITGWNDFMVRGVSANFRELKKRGGSELSRTYQKIVIGPWVHGHAMLGTVDEIDYGLASSGPAIDMTGMHLKWFDYWLKGIKNGITDEPPVKLFIMGENKWRDENEWPLARTVYTKYYLHSRGRANTRFGDGLLSTEKPSGEQNDVFMYDPRNPVPSKWEAPSSSAYIYVIQDQRGIEERPDVLVFTTPPLQEKIEVTGPIQLVLYASSSAVDTDFTGKLVDVWPNGKAYNLTHGIVRARYRNSAYKPEFIEPGKVYEFTIDLGVTGIVFKAGHCIRLEISSSNYPEYDRNQNTGNPIGQDAEIEVATQTIFHTDKYLSHLLLPIIPDR